MIPHPLFITSGLHLSEYRVQLGYATLAEAHAAHDAIARREAAQPDASQPGTEGEARSETQERERVVSELLEMSRLSRAVAAAKRDDVIGSFGAEEDLCQAAYSLRLSDALLNAAVEIERLASLRSGNGGQDQ